MGVRRIPISGMRIAKSLGYGSSYPVIITTAVLAITSFFYIYTVGSYFKVDVYVLHNRVTYYTFFDKYVVNKSVDHIIIVCGIALNLALLSFKERVRWRRFVISAIFSVLLVTAAILMKQSALLDFIALLSFPLFILFLIYDKFMILKKNHLDIKNSSTMLYVNYLAIIGIATGIAGIIIPIMLLFTYYSQTYTTILASIPNYARQLFVLFSSSSPILIFLLVFCFPIKLLITEFTVKLKEITNNSPFVEKRIKTGTKIIFLILFMLLSIIIALIPHESAINKNNHQVGADTADYVNMLNSLRQSHDVQEFFQKSFISIQDGDRPLTLIFLSTMTKIIPFDLLHGIEFMPTILGPALVLVVYFLMRELTPKSDITSLFASFLTAISFQILIGIYAGFYANWFALIVGYLSFVFLFRFLKIPSKVNIATYSVLMILLIFSHVYTWTILAIVAGILLGVMFRMKYYPRKSVFLLLLVVLSSVVIDILRTTVTHSSLGTESDIEHRVGGGTNQISQRWSNLVYVTQVEFGGILGNFIILILAVYWLIRCKLTEPSSIFIVVFLSIGILPLFVGDVLIQSRVLYDIPFQIPAAIALTYIKKESDGVGLLLPIGIWLIGMSIIAVFNFQPSQ